MQFAPLALRLATRRAASSCVAAVGAIFGASSRAAAVTLVGALALSTAGCDSEAKPIDRTQVNQLAKSKLRGVWYEIDMITDVPPTAAFGFAGQTNFGGEDAGKVMFDVQENFLVVYPTTEKVVGGGAKWNKRKIRKYWDSSVMGRDSKKVLDSDFIEIYVGNPVAMYPIISHFDVKRDYAASTGEQTNVLVENTVDRPWWQREYFRVDWAGNQILNFMFPQTSVRYSALDYFVQADDADNPAKFYMAKTNDYFHFTRRLYGQPMSTGACSPYSLAPGDCSGAVVEVRIAFRRLDVKRTNDYEVRRYNNDPDQEKFGYFLAERYRFDEDYGLIYSGKDSKAGRWNLWQTSKTFAPELDKAGQNIKCLTNRDCAEPAVCDQSDWFETGFCAKGSRKEYSQRGLRPVTYHISVDHPANHLEAVYGTADGWSDAFKETVSWLKFWEEKWAADNVKGFTDPQSSFGQRFCKSNADCATVATAALELHTKGQSANRVFVPIAKDSGVVVQDCTVGAGSDKCTDRGASDKGAFVALINASPGTTLSLKGLPGGDITGVAFTDFFDKKDGKLTGGRTVLKAIDSGKIVAAGSLATVNLTVENGAKSFTVPNIKLVADDVVLIVVVGGDAPVVVRGKGTKGLGLRVVNGLKTAATGDLSAGKTYEVGVNGVRMHEGLPYAAASEGLFSAGEAINITLVEPGHRADVNCATVKGVGQCHGWSQKLVAADLKRREDIEAALPAMFVACENQFTRSYAQCQASGELGKPSVHNDCRYWVADGKDHGRPGKQYNPCADKTGQGEVPEAAKVKIQGDARYSFLYWVTKVHASSPLGYGPSAQDPDTGETFWAIANVYGASQLTYSQYAKDLVDLINGDLDPKDLATGKYIKDYIKNKNKSSYDKALLGALADKELQATPDQAHQAAVARATLHMADAGKNLAQAQGSGVTLPTVAEMNDLGSPKAVDKWLMDNLPSVDLDALQARAEKIKGTGYESAMINDEMVLVGSQGDTQPGQAVNPEQIDKISPVGWASPKGAMDEKRRMQFLGINSIELAEFQDPALLGLAERMKCDPGDEPKMEYEGDGIGKNICYKGDALRTAISVALYKATLEHEVGHTVGLRHNFSASTDVMNYLDPYFDEAKGGRARDYIACADLTYAGNVIGANSFCEKDTFGEECDLKHTCAADSDCPNGTSCSSKTKQCTDADGATVGVCQQHIEVRTPCTGDTALSVCGGGGACVEGDCHDKFQCKGASDCLSGELCDGGFCVDPRTKAARTTLQFAAKVGDARKYVSRAGLTPEEIAGRRTEYQHSSVMDYGQKINSDVWGLGKYDHAAIKYGYGELTEVYHDTNFIRDRVKSYAKNTGQSLANSSGNAATEYWKNTPYTQFTFLNEWMPPELNSKRYSVPDIFVLNERQMADNHFREEMDRTFYEVPYKYCSDEYRGGAMGCYYFDTGANMEEIVHHAAEALEEYYIFDAFKRERLWFARGGSYLSYMARINDRWLTPIQAAGRYYALYNNIFRVYGWFGYWDMFNKYGAPLRRASENSFRALTNMLATPSPGSYVFDKKTNTYVNIDYETGRPGSQLDIALGQGKFPYTTFATQKGYYMYDHPLWIGAYWDKVAAIQALTNSTVSFLSEYVGEQLPVFRATAIGYNTVYPAQLAQVLGGLVAGDIAQFAGSVDKGKTKLEYRQVDPFKPLDSTAERVAPSVINHGLRLFAAWQAIANLPAGFDSSYTDAMAVWLKGHGPQFTIGTGKMDGKDVVLDICEFEDPFGKKTYVAARPNYTVNRYSAAFALCKKLNLLKTGCGDGSQCQPCAAGDTACSGQGMCNDKQPCRGEQWWTKAQGAEKETLTQQMKLEIEVLDHLRELYSIYGSIGAAGGN